MNLETRTEVKKIIFNIIGVAFIGFGFALMASSGIGLDCLDSFNEALSVFVNRDFSVVASAVELIMILVAYVLDKDKIGLGTILYMLIIDIPLSFFEGLLPNSGSFVLSVIYSLMGVVFLAFGIELTIHTGLGTVAYEAFIYGLKKKLEFSFVMTKYIIDGILLVFVVLLGHRIELGTIIYFVSCPLIMEQMSKLIKKHVKI